MTVSRVERGLFLVAGAGLYAAALLLAGSEPYIAIACAYIAGISARTAGR